ncbi:hypothetical protein [Niveibacterium sp.]|uniref:hypothetical protein n=1 Tax=Niveibacterium sp. TaxID=2017444 RepID=UPI0035B10EFB
MKALSMRWRAALLATALLAAPGIAGAAACEPFLDVLDAARETVVLSLSRCDVRPAAAWPDPWQASTWRLSARARERWRKALAGDGLHSDLLAARLRARPADPQQLPGPLLLRISARLPAPAAWRWDAERGELAFAPHPSEAQACGGPGGLMIWDHTVDAAPASVVNAKVWRVERPGLMHALPDDCVDRWSVDLPASVDQHGLIRIPPDTLDGSLVNVRAEVGGREVKGSLRVFDTHRHPLAGRWHQVAELACDGRERSPGEPVQELIFDAGGEFSVTRQPFEAYKDYLGRYRHDPERGTITFTAEGGNRIPEGLRLQGTAVLQGRTLTLEQVQLWPAPSTDARCGMRFER